MKNRSEVEDAYTKRRTEVRLLAKRICELTEGIPALGPDGPQVDWGHVGDLGRLKGFLSEAVDFLERK